MMIRDHTWRDDPALRYKLPRGVIALQAECSSLRDDVLRLEQEASAARQAKLRVIRENEMLRRDAALGRLVREMPVDSEFYHNETEKWRIVYRSEGGRHCRISTTPEAALEEALESSGPIGYVRVYNQGPPT